MSKKISSLSNEMILVLAIASTVADSQYSFNEHLHRLTKVSAALSGQSPAEQPLSVEALRQANQKGANSQAKKLLNWNQAFRIAQRHGLSSLLARNIQKIDSSILPKEFLRPLAMSSLTNQKNAVKQAKILRNLLSVFNEHDIHVFPYKGIALSYFVYGDIATRQSSDIDLVLTKNKLPKARELMHTMGYTALDVASNRLQRVLRGVWENQEHYYQPESKVPVELHWDISSAMLHSRYRLRDVWNILDRRYFENTPVLIPPPSEHLIILCLHGTKHQWSHLKWLCDIHELICNFPELDWQKVITLTQEKGTYNRVFTGLRLSHTLLGTPIPAPIVNSHLNSPLIQQLALEMITALYDEESELLARKYLRRISLYEQFPDRIFYLFAISVGPLYQLLGRSKLPNALQQLFGNAKLKNKDK